ncbi:MAG: 3-dehydroquinate synthase [Planctomycetes bacterium]|nr:3-dehydroquinate synthase [Planctomycetota bacterium]
MPQASKPDNSKSSEAGAVVVRAASREYHVRCGRGLLAAVGMAVRSVAPGKRAHLIADAGLPRALVDSAMCSLRGEGYAVSLSQTTATETHKSLDAAAEILRAMLAAKHERSDPVVSLGGGIVTDLAGFVAATYRRGVPVAHCPTTLLAMVDAAVGGKTGVNLALPGSAADGLAKNMVGAFWQPHLVLCDTDTLESLPQRQLSAGLAECLKHGLISRGLPAGEGRDDSLWAWTLASLEACRRLEPTAVAELVSRNVAVKAGVVSADEREEAPSSKGGRALLNLGHTFAHAMETLAGLSPVGGPSSADSAAFMLHHGEAVGLGLIAAAAASRKLGWLSDSDVDAVRGAVARCGLPTAVKGLPSDSALVERMSHDKKTAGGVLRLILPQSLGEAAVVENPRMDAIAAGWAAVRG